jgi:hypothetical protein
MPSKIICFYLLVFVISSPMYALDSNGTTMARAYEYFKNRDNFENIEAAKKIYLTFLQTPNQELSVKKEALSKLGRLSIFQGDIGRELFNINNKQAAKIFTTCIKATDYLSPQKIAVEIPEYVYWRAMCLSFLGANLKPTELLLKMTNGWLDQLKELITLGKEKFETFENYGFHRIEAGINIRSKILVVLDLYNPKNSLNLIEKSMINGTDIYINYLIKYEAQMALNKKSDAKATLKHGITELEQRFKAGDIPEDLIIENKIFLIRMREELARFK